MRDRQKRTTKKKSVYSPYLLLIPTTTAAPSPASSPTTAAGLFAAGVSVVTGFTVGTSCVGAGVGVAVGVAVGVGVGVSVSQMEVPWLLLLFRTAGACCRSLTPQSASFFYPR